MGKREVPKEAVDTTNKKTETKQTTNKKVKPSPKSAQTNAQCAGRCGAVIDLDGVVYRKGKDGYELIPGAREALVELERSKIPHIFVTNGTGVTEAEKAKTIRELVKCEYITTDHVILATTPLRVLSDPQSNVLVVASSSTKAYQQGKHFGWEKMISVQEFAAKNGILTPEIKRNLPTTRSTDDEPIDAIVVFSAPDNWAEGLQIICDVARSSGSVGEEMKEQRVPIYASNPDVEYATTHSVPRFTCGAFLLCASALFEASTGRSLAIQYHGKPYEPIYTEARKRLSSQSGVSIEDFTKIYAIGDNPKSDIKGANDAGANFHSILVRTGVFKDLSGQGNSSEYPAKTVCDDLSQAVEYIFEQRGGSSVICISSGSM